jgi:DNA-binding beta-propeller fold protein YncE
MYSTRRRWVAVRAGRGATRRPRLRAIGGDDRPVADVEHELERKRRDVEQLVQEERGDIEGLFRFLADLRPNEAATVERVHHASRDVAADGGGEFPPTGATDARGESTAACRRREGQYNNDTCKTGIIDIRIHQGVRGMADRQQSVCSERADMTRRSVLASGTAAVGSLAVGSGTAAGRSEGSNSAAGTDVVFIANSKGGTVSIVDATTFEHIRDVDIVPDGKQAGATAEPVQGTAGQRAVEAFAGENYAQDLNVSPDGRTLYVSRGHRGDVAAFDIATGELLWNTFVDGLRSDHMTMSADGEHLFVSAIAGDNDEVAHKVATGDGDIVGSFRTGEFPHDNTLSPDGELVYNSSIGNILQPREARENRPEGSEAVLTEPYLLTAADAETLEIVDRHEFDRGIRPLEITADGRFMYAQLSFLHGFIEYDLEQGRKRRTVHLPERGRATEMDEEDYPFEAPHHGLAMSPDEELICVAARVSDYAAVVRRETLEPVAFIGVGKSPGWAANTPDGRHCVISSELANTVSFISYERQEKVATVAVGEVPKYAIGAVVPDGVL